MAANLYEYPRQTEPGTVKYYIEADTLEEVDEVSSVFHDRWGPGYGAWRNGIGFFDPETKKYTQRVSRGATCD